MVSRRHRVRMSTKAPVEPVEPIEPTTASEPIDAESDARSSSRFVTWLAGLTLLGFVVRVLNVLWWRPTTDIPGYHGYRLWALLMLELWHEQCQPTSRLS